MSPVHALLLIIAGVFLLGALGEVLFRRTGIPDVLWLVVAGIAVGPAGGLVTRRQLLVIAPYLAAVTLVVILFQGGTAIKLRDLRHSAPRSSLIAALGFGLSVAAVAGASAAVMAMGLAPRGWTALHGVLMGVILGGSSSVVIMPAMAQARVRRRLADLLNLESALTDILCVVFTGALIELLAGHRTGGASAGVQLLVSFAVGVGLGASAGLLWVLLLRLVRLEDHAYPVTLAMLLGLYVLIDRAGGSAALGIFTVAVILGNAGAIEERLGMLHPVGLDPEVRGVHQQIAFIIKTLFFVFLGAMLGPPWSLVLVGAGLALVLLAARIPAVQLGTLGTDLSRGERRLAAVSLPRGLAAGVLATLPVAAGLPATSHLPDLVFSAVITTVIVFSVGFPLAARAVRAGGSPSNSETDPALPGRAPGPPAPPTARTPLGSPAPE